MALDLGPGRPLMKEELGDHVRRYVLYALMGSTGAIYIILEPPILEILTNPISVILVLLIFGGTFFIMSVIGHDWGH